MRKFFVSILFMMIVSFAMASSYQPKYSTAGFYELSKTGRTVYSMNPAWRFHKGDVTHAEETDYDDSSWEVVSLPNGIE